MLLEMGMTMIKSKLKKSGYEVKESRVPSLRLLGKPWEWWEVGSELSGGFCSVSVSEGQQRGRVGNVRAVDHRRKGQGMLAGVGKGGRLSA